MTGMEGTTIVCVKRNGEVAMAGDGQVTQGNQIVKMTARKVRRVGGKHGGNVLAGFAGSTADAMTLLERFEKQLDEHHGNLLRAAGALMKDWRSDKYLRRLEAMMIVADASEVLMLSGSGDMLEPENGIMAIGSGGGFAQAAALAMLETTDLTASEIARRSIEIASRICIYTNNSVILEEIRK
ncbi:MAG: ATP-dependent protease subunit HslV [Synergistaceae bacterium]|jgi:ATP-dependent HslUV protease subunit HslV|nr:ATP-dependent protease subunit HslV [Synergistaceae bacterium]